MRIGTSIHVFDISILSTTTSGDWYGIRNARHELRVRLLSYADHVRVGLDRQHKPQALCDQVLHTDHGSLERHSSDPASTASGDRHHPHATSCVDHCPPKLHSKPANAEYLYCRWRFLDLNLRLLPHRIRITTPPL